MVRRKVLLVEDHDDICKLMECALSGEFELITARDGKSALKLVQEQSPIVILLDLSLPPNPASPEEGLRLLRELQRYGSDSKVIITTGFHDRQLAIKAISLGVYDFLTKPVDLNLLRLLVRRASWIAELERKRANLPPAETEIPGHEKNNKRYKIKRDHKILPRSS